MWPFGPTARYLQQKVAAPSTSGSPNIRSYAPVEAFYALLPNYRVESVCQAAVLWYSGPAIIHWETIEHENTSESWSNKKKVLTCKPDFHQIQGVQN